MLGLAMFPLVHLAACLCTATLSSDGLVWEQTALPLSAAHPPGVSICSCNLCLGGGMHGFCGLISGGERLRLNMPLSVSLHSITLSISFLVFPLSYFLFL